jgi:hypothetical protein
LRIVGSVPEHPAHFLIAAPVISFEIAFVSTPKRVAVDENRALLATGLGNINDNDRFAVHLEKFDIGFAAYRGDQFLRIVLTVPKRFEKSFGIIHSAYDENIAFLLFDTEDDNIVPRNKKFR